MRVNESLKDLMGYYLYKRKERRDVKTACGFPLNMFRSKFVRKKEIQN